MRCKCCDTENSSYSEELKDFYCGECKQVIRDTITEDKVIYEKEQEKVKGPSS